MPDDRRASTAEAKAPALSAIVVIPDTYETVRLTMSHLRAQSAAEQMEIVIVVPSGWRAGIDESELACFHSWSVVEVGSIRSIGAGFVAGIRRARAPIVALTEDHSFPDARWAESFIGAHQESWAVVGPGMRNGNPETMLSWADFYQAYGEWSPAASAGPVSHLPGHNSSYKRDILLAQGERLDILMEAESVLHRHLRAGGHGLLLQTATCTTHLNFDAWSVWIPARFHTGRQYAATWARWWSRPRRLLFAVASPLIPWVRLWRVSRAVRRGESVGFLLRLLPAMTVGLMVEGLGHFAGYAWGYGSSIEKISKYEFHRLSRGAPGGGKTAHS